MNTTDIIRVGQHIARIEPPDIVVMHWRGEVMPHQMVAMYDELEKFASRVPHVFAMIIVRDAMTFGPETRKVAATDPRSQLIVARAVVGASFQMRVLATLLMKAKGLIHRNRVAPMIFCDTEDEGRAWLVKKRQELAAASR